MGPIGIFDSGYGGLTIFREISKRLPQYDYIYLGDNARVPYGNRSFETVYTYTKECVEQLFNMGCHLIILACNTASAKALRTLQQHDLPLYPDTRRILGVIRPTTELAGNFTKSREIGILATQGTIKSESYPIEIKKFFPDITIHQQACPLWVPLVENNELDSPGTSFFVKKYIDLLLNQSEKIDTIILACTHYPLLLPIIQQHVPPHIKIVSQADIIATGLENYLKQHPEIASLCSQNSSTTFYTTDSATSFEEKAAIFYGEPVQASHISMP